DRRPPEATPIRYRRTFRRTRRQWTKAGWDAATAKPGAPPAPAPAGAVRHVAAAKTPAAAPRGRGPARQPGGPGPAGAPAPGRRWRRAAPAPSTHNRARS